MTYAYQDISASETNKGAGANQTLLDKVRNCLGFLDQAIGTKIKILPADLVPVNGWDDVVYSSHGIGASSAKSFIVNKSIPPGYTASAVRMYCPTSTARTVTVYSVDITTGSGVQQGSAGTCAGEVAISTAYDANTQIEIVLGSGTAVITGGYITIGKT